MKRRYPPPFSHAVSGTFLFFSPAIRLYRKKASDKSLARVVNGRRKLSSEPEQIKIIGFSASCLRCSFPWNYLPNACNFTLEISHYLYRNWIEVPSDPLHDHCSHKKPKHFHKFESKILKSIKSCIRSVILLNNFQKRVVLSTEKEPKVVFAWSNISLTILAAISKRTCSETREA